jgi:hypothetical protein
MTPADWGNAPEVQIVEAIISRIKGLAKFKDIRHVPIPPLQPDKLPALGVYFMGTEAPARGDADVAPPKFVCDAMFGIMVVYAMEDPVVLNGKVAALMFTIKNTLLSDATFKALPDVVSGEPFIEAFPRYRQTIAFPKDGETYYCDARLGLTVRWNEDYPPSTSNILQTVAVTAQPFGEAGTTFENEFSTSGS